jgi:hypothetical protein
MSVAITGNTYPVRDILKRLGGTWDAARKAWIVPDDKAAEARSVVNAAYNDSTHSETRCWECGLPRRNSECEHCGSD